MMEVSVRKEGQSHRFNERRRGTFCVVNVFENNTVELASLGKQTARINIERLTKIRERPEHLKRAYELTGQSKQTATDKQNPKNRQLHR